MVGGGGFRAPLTYEALLAAGSDEVDEFVLHDLDSGRLERTQLVIAGLAAERGASLPVRATADRAAALEGADVVFCAVRVGGMEGRVIDERIPLELGVVGQETVGPGGIAYALRTIPVLVDLARDLAAIAPRAWLVNFTNPAGMVTEALRGVLGHRVVGICDTPPAMFRGIAEALDRRPEELWFDYFGLNHLGWVRAVRDETGDLLPGLLADDERLARTEEGRLYGGRWLRSLGLLPSEYLTYFYSSAEVVARMREAGGGRAEQILASQKPFYDEGPGSPEAALASWRSARDERERTYMAEAREGEEREAPEDNYGYATVAMDVVRALTRNARTTLVLDTANRGALPFLRADDVVEVPCVVGSSGPEPLAVGDVPLHARALIEAVKSVERLTVQAALTRDPEAATSALALHPLVPSRGIAEALFERYRAAHPELRALFA
jgi:6-phospho-beta-glucosidase